MKVAVAQTGKRSPEQDLMRAGFGDLEILDCQRLTCLVHYSGSHVASSVVDLWSPYQDRADH
jgi:hypothetical protein